MSSISSRFENFMGNVLFIEKEDETSIEITIYNLIEILVKSGKIMAVTNVNSISAIWSVITAIWLACMPQQ